jgi:hypothetical protein
MDIAEKIYKEASRLPEHLAKEVLDFKEPAQPPQNRQTFYLRAREILKKCSGSLADDIVAERDDRV